MKRSIWYVIIFASFLFLSLGCAMQVERAEEGAEKVGKTTGKVMGVPAAAGEGAAEGIMGESESNPYDR